jgi:hypothetical protein
MSPELDEVFSFSSNAVAGSSAAASAIVSIVEPARYPLIAGDYPEMATWDTMLHGSRRLEAGPCGTGYYR